MTKNEYNGWTNYETWNVKLWIDNHQGSHGYWSNQAQEAYDCSQAGNYGTRLENATRALADTLKDSFDEQSCELLDNAKQSASVWADLLGAALSEVNWQEIAQSFMDNIKEAA